MFDANDCAVELLKMKSCEDFKKVVAPSSGVAGASSQSDPVAGIVCLKPPDPDPLPGSVPSSTAEPTESTPVPNTNGGSTNGIEQSSTPVLVFAKKSSPFEVKPKPCPCDAAPLKKSDPVPSTSSKAGRSVSSSVSSTVNSSSATSVTSNLTTDEDATTIDSSSDEELDSYINQFSRGGDNNEPEEELVVRRNREYLVNRCTSLMHRLQGIVQGTTANHLSKQYKSLVEHPVFNCNSSPKNSSFQHNIPHNQRLTKQDISEVEFGSIVIKNILRHSMGQKLDVNADSATEESEPDDDELVLPDERLQDVGGNIVDNAHYLPVENNPFINVVKLEKQYEARRTFLDRSISECEYSLNKSIALKRHCKVRKPVFQLEKPSTSTNNSINQVSQVGGSETRVGSDVSHVCRVSEMISTRRPSLEERRLVNGENGESQTSEVTGKSETDSESSEAGTSSREANQESNPKSNGSGENELNAFIPKIKTSDGSSVLGVEFCSKSDPSQISSRCVAIKRPEKNRKVFQLGGIQNIFRDADRLPTLRCTCFGRQELCALCLGRAKKKAEINQVHMSFKDKLAILDETFHRNLSFPEDTSLEALLASTALGNNFPITLPTTELQEILRQRAREFPPDVLRTGARPKRPRTYEINAFVETEQTSPKKNRYNEEAPHSPRKRQNTRKSQSSFEEKDIIDMLAGKGFGWPNRERKDSQSVRRTRNQEFDIDNIVIPYSMAATTRVEQLVYKPIETPRWRVLEREEIFANMSDESSGELDDMSDAAFIARHAKCEVEEKKRFTQSLQKALNATRKTRRLDSTCRNDGDVLTHDENSSSSHPLLSPDKTRDRESNNPFSNSADGTTTPDPSTVITEAMANQALKSLFKVGNRRRTMSTSVKVEEDVEVDPTPTVVVEPWPARKFPLSDDEYKEMVDCMEQCYAESALEFAAFQSSHLDDPPSSPNYVV